MPYTLTAERGFCTIDGVRLSYLDWGGEGPSTVLLHGITSNAATLWRVAPALRATGQRILALDMPGHRLSELSPDHEIDTIANLVAGFTDALDLQAITLLGHSWGGATALALAGGTHPARRRLARVVLVDPALVLDLAWAEVRLPLYLEGVGVPAAVAAPRARALNPTWLDQDVYWKAIALAECRAAQVEGFFRPANFWSLVPRLAAVTVPLLLLVADPAFTVITPEDLAQAERTLVPGLGKMVVLPDTNHNMLRGPGYEPTMATLLAWLAQPEPAPPNA
ncbi:MAG: alpha/beta fold hydrolase [Oscillochloridaceae bacterium umkhey_bin13]